MRAASVQAAAIPENRDRRTRTSTRGSATTFRYQSAATPRAEATTNVPSTCSYWSGVTRGLPVRRPVVVSNKTSRPYSEPSPTAYNNRGGSLSSRKNRLSIAVAPRRGPLSTLEITVTFDQAPRRTREQQCPTPGGPRLRGTPEGRATSHAAIEDSDHRAPFGSIVARNRGTRQGAPSLLGSAAVDLGRGSGVGEVVALRSVAAECPQHTELLRRFHAFGHHPQRH